MIPLGYEVGTGRAVAIPLHHLAVTGQTQQSGKTTTLEALVTRSGLRAVAFVTKRAEGSFTAARTIPPYFRERADWQFVSAVLEATLRERLRFERSWIMRACKGARTLADVQANVRAAMPKARGLSADVYMTLDEYLSLVIPQVDRLPYAATLRLAPGLNVMDLASYTTELQALVIRSVLEWVYAEARDTVVVIPEAWEFIPQARSSPVLLAAEQLIRKGGAARNYVWLDSQDIAAVHKNILRSVGVWILGVQREANEVKRVLAHIPRGVSRPSLADVMHLGRGQFFACFHAQTTRVYVQPAWMSAADARAIARGERPIDSVAPPTRHVDDDEDEEADVTKAEAQRLRDENARLRARIEALESERRAVPLPAPTRDVHPTQPPRRAQRPAPAPTNTPKATPVGGDVDEALYQAIKRRLLAELPHEPAILRVATERPELLVTVERPVLDASGETLFGRLARLIAEGYFDEARTGNAAFQELKRRGFPTAKPNVYREADKLALRGFLTKEADGYRAVPGMKVNIVER